MPSEVRLFEEVVLHRRLVNRSRRREKAETQDADEADFRSRVDL